MIFHRRGSTGWDNDDDDDDSGGDDDDDNDVVNAIILAWFRPCILGWFWPILYFLCETST